MKRWLPLLLIAIIVLGMAFVIHPKSEEKPTDLVPVSSLVPGVYRAAA